MFITAVIAVAVDSDADRILLGYVLIKDKVGSVLKRDEVDVRNEIRLRWTFDHVLMWFSLDLGIVTPCRTESLSREKT